MLNFAAPNNGKNGQALDRRPVSLSLLQGRVPRVRPRVFRKEKNKMNKNTDLCMDIKTFLQSDKRTKLGKEYQGVLTRITSETYTFVETLPWMKKRNPRVFNGKYISITRRKDGTLRPNFKPMPKLNGYMGAEKYAFEVYRELHEALTGLIEKEGWRPFGMDW